MPALNLVISDGQRHKDNAIFGWVAAMCPHQEAGHPGHIHPAHTHYGGRFCINLVLSVPNVKTDHTINYREARMLAILSTNIWQTLQDAY